MPRLAGVRAGLLAGLLLAALRGLWPSSAVPDVIVARAGQSCRFHTEVAGARSCACRDWNAAVRRVLELPQALNRATVLDLQRIPGIGPVRASAIVRHRERMGPFEEPAELVQVRGIGPLGATRLQRELFAGDRDPACEEGIGDPTEPKRRSTKRLWPDSEKASGRIADPGVGKARGVPR